MQHCSVILIAAALDLGCARGTPATPVVDPAPRMLEATVSAVGGRDAITAVHTLVMKGDGQGFILGQGQSPDNGVLKYRISEHERTIDVANGRWRQRQTLTPEWAAQSREPSTETTALDGDVAFDIEGDGSAARTTDAVARDRRAELRHSPIGILQAALVPGATVSSSRHDGDHDVLDVRAPGGQRFTLTIDAATRLPVSVASMTDESTLGDVVVETEFAGYQRTGALTLPTLVTSKLDHQIVATIRVSNTVNPAVGELAAPPEVKAAPAPSAAPVVTTEQLAPGVWLLAGGSHHSVVVELADHLLLIEAPLDDVRTLAVIAAARALRPAKPLTHVVCTHHHFDHAGGVRAAVSEGLTIIAHERSKRFLEDLVSRRHTIVPDALARHPRPLTLETVTGQRTIDDPQHPVQLYVADSPHADTMLVGYLPRERLLIEVDLYTPAPANAPGLAHPYAGHLLRVIESQHLSVDRVVSLHRQSATFADLVKAAQPPPPP